ncbi:hypothetical protein [Venatoribacter cucullus]|uniref:Uncharacterized protein n=1 Tax=Venatoribacter cucullus TaxID=2661630 RepID=A0A9E8JMF4_9GAMM|nr:hypothetical protein [Venatoribacter cucullus]QQD23850.1 hypothetical protein GJQ55_04860 [Venatoribacter cucullus]UZK03973.1 hypothetical protein GAY96_08750 [Venatoribacter cucullus]
MINEWQPVKTTTAAQIDLQMLQMFAALGERIQAGEQTLADQLSAAQQQQASAWLQLQEEDWQPALQQLPPQQLFPLALFYTLAEQQLSGWQCGKRNPAIWIFRWLRQHNQLPDKEAIRQLKKLTDNRYIPYGSVL